MEKIRSQKRKPKIDDWHSLTPEEVRQLRREPNWKDRLTPNARREQEKWDFIAYSFLVLLVLFGIFVFAKCTSSDSTSPLIAPSATPSATPSPSECNRFVSISDISDYLTVIEPNVYGSKDGFALLDTIVIAKVQNERFDQRFFNVTLSGAAWNRIATVADLMTELETALCAAP